MRSAWVSRCFFAVVAVMAVSALLSGTACTRWGQPGPITPSIAPISSIYVSPSTGSDTTGNGSVTSPYKTLTKAVTVLANAKSLSPTGVSIYLASGDYSTANGEIFPIVVPTGVSIIGTNYGGGPRDGSFIDGSGQDLLFEALVRAPARSAYTTLEVVSTASVSLSDIYVGASKLTLPNSRAAYASLDVLGTVSGGTSSFGAGIVSSSPKISGVLVPGGSFTCSSCQIHGNDFGIGALSVPIATASPANTVPSITLQHSTGDSTVAAKVADILTDGSANVTASGEAFEKGQYAFEDSLQPVTFIAARGTVDFGGGLANSAGGNVFIGARIAEISLIRRFETISALDDTWNPNQQQANRNGQYTRTITFGSGATGKNVKILHDAAGSTVTVGPAPVTTPTPSSSPSTSPSPTPT